MTKGLVTIFGGSGFIGRHAARQLVKAGYRVRVACRRTGAAGDVRLAGPPGWVDLVQANVRDRASVTRALEGADAVVNLVGILHEQKAQNFDGTHVQGARNLAELAAEKGITRFVQVSAIGADAESKSKYARTKAAAEAAVREVIPGAIILRPSVVFGTEDNFFNRFAQMTKGSFFLPSIGGGKTRFQPVYSGDMADAITAAVDREDTTGKTYELGGRQVYTLNEIYDFVLHTISRRRIKLPIPFAIAKYMGVFLNGFYKVPVLNLLPAAFVKILPATNNSPFWTPPLTGDQVDFLKTNRVVSASALGLAELGITELESIEAIVPTYLWRHRPYGEFTEVGKA